MEWKPVHKRIILFILAGFFCAAAFFTPGFRTQAYAMTVRIGFYEIPGFHEYDEFGNPSGYGVDYLNKISEKTGWNYEFIPVKKWEDALAMLGRGDIDLLAPAQRTQERDGNFIYSSYSIGQEFGALLTLNNRDDLIYEDFDTFSEINIGCSGTSVYEGDFKKYARIKGFAPNIIHYQNTDEAIAAMEQGEIDAVITNLMLAKQHMKVLAKFAPSQIYFIANAGRGALMQELEQAVSEIKTEAPGFENELADKYYGLYNETPFTKKELEFAENAPVYTVACPADTEPVSFLDEQTGEVSGITRDILDEVARISGLNFRYVPLPAGEIDYDTLRSLKVDLAADIEYNSLNAFSDGLRLSIPYFEAKKVFVGKKGMQFDKQDSMALALPTGSVTLPQIVKTRYPNMEIQVYRSIQDCMDAVLDGEADVMLQNQYCVEKFISRPKYEELSIIPKEGMEDLLCLSMILYRDEKGVVSEELSDERLMSLIDKSIKRLSEDTISQIVIKYTVNRPYTFTIGDFVYRYKYFIAALAAALAAAGGMIAYAYRMHEKNLRLLANSEMQIRNITNNINGGVVVLLPEEKNSISYANEGFLGMIHSSGKSADDIRGRLFEDFVRKEDGRELEAMMKRSLYNWENVSVKLHIRRQDGKFIPVLCNVTPVFGDDKRELYCVIMDISEQENMLAKLEAEQEKFQIIMERSEDMIFDFDFGSGEIAMTQLFREKFGWTLPPRFIGNDVDSIESMWRIAQEDAGGFREALARAVEEKKDSVCEVRISVAEGGYKWCRVSFHVICRKGELSDIIGKVADIDEEFKEKEQLIRQSREDSLTGLLNKQAFYKEASAYLKKHPDTHTAAVFLDLDNFKLINDMLGHMAGDQAIRETGEKLWRIFRKNDIIARFGGDEFCILVKDIPMELLEDRLSTAVDTLRAVYRGDGHEVKVTASIGAACFPEHGRDIKELLSCADQALYCAKNSSKDKYVIYEKSMGFIK